ncbi:P2RX7 [Branchiostoma lanceolatum]|uniref:P2RX7 protein n=1 Tax=Branchiostoma lanceolatum TaxID=7740 RepID=A0A8K0ET69_BRALA|nr:P2RX7 [Branchiostoma lanceolatum]
MESMDGGGQDATGRGGGGQNAKGKGGGGQDTTGRGGGGQNATGRGGGGQNATGRGGGGQDATGRGGGGQNAKGKGGGGQDTTGRGGGGQNATGRGGGGRNATGRRRRGRNAKGKGGGGQDATGRDGGGQNATGRGGSGQEAEEGGARSQLSTEKIQEMKDWIKGLTSDELTDVLVEATERLPSLVFDIVEIGARRGGSANNSNGLQWCTCGHCREMPTDLERQCCVGGPASCISTLADMDLYILDEGILRLARAYRNDLLGLQDGQDEVKEFRHAAYRQFLLWQSGRLYDGNKVVIPSCCVWRIRDTFPDPNAQYTGYIPNRKV